MLKFSGYSGLCQVIRFKLLVRIRHTCSKWIAYVDIEWVCEQNTCFAAVTWTIRFRWIQMSDSSNILDELNCYYSPHPVTDYVMNVPALPLAHKTLCKAQRLSTINYWGGLNDADTGLQCERITLRIMRSEFYWFTEICNSQCLSHFAASFIDSRAEESTV